jgi:hypothetical protein
MSSTIEGRDDWAREDDLDLGQDPNQDELQLHPAAATSSNSNGVIKSGNSSEELKDGSIAYIEEDIQDPAAQNHVSRTELDSPSPLQSPIKSPRPELIGSDGVDDVASNPDDTPSLHVGVTIHRLTGESLMVSFPRDQSGRRRVVVHWHFVALLLFPALARRIVHLTFGSSRGCQLHLSAASGRRRRFLHKSARESRHSRAAYPRPPLSLTRRGVRTLGKLYAGRS